jgi:hypothetical protein
VELPLFGADTDHHAFNLPRPFRSGLSVAAIGLLPLIVGLTGLVRPLSGFVFTGIFVAAGVLRASLGPDALVAESAPPAGSYRFRATSRANFEE